jgi:hypothetical protein
LEKTVDTGFQSVYERIDKLREEFVPRDLYNSEMTAVRDQLAAGTDNRRFAITTALAVVAALVALAALIAPLVA